LVLGPKRKELATYLDGINKRHNLGGDRPARLCRRLDPMSHIGTHAEQSGLVGILVKRSKIRQQNELK